jgi:hydroxymethylpyrimidine/phosphomethylpyrimidine kinase
MKMLRYIPVLTIAGSDSGGGAGIQADLKTFSALGCFGTSAITAVTAQNTLGVTGIHSIPPDMVRDQILAVLLDIKPKAIKIGMVHSPELAHTISETLKPFQKKIPIVFDPVMVATSGDKLIEEATIEVLKKELIPLASLLTPNLDEAEILTGIKIKSVNDMERAADQLLNSGCHAILLKGGHLGAKNIYDVLAQGKKHRIFKSAFIASHNVHGTGCTLSSAIAVHLAKGLTLDKAVSQSLVFVHQAIKNGANVKTGKGNGPLNHFFHPKKLVKR